MSGNSQKTARIAVDLALLVAASIPVIFYRLGHYSIVGGDEAIYQGIAEAMVESGHWFRLEFRGEPRLYDTFMNAPIQYWMRAVLIESFGSNLWTMRISSASFGLASILATYALGTQLRDRRTGLLAGFVQLTTLHFVAIHGARTGELDTTVAFLVTLAAITFLRAMHRSGRWIWLTHHLCLVGLVNLKLPIVMIPVIAELFCFAVIPRYRRHFAGWLVTGLAIAPFGLGWHIYQCIELGDTAQRVFLSMLGHATGGVDLETPVGFWINVDYYAEALLFGAFPFAFVYPIAVVSVLARSARAPDRDRIFVVAGFLLAIATFHLGLAAHLRQYLLPAYPLLSVFVAIWIFDIARRRADLWSIAAVALVAALSIGVEIEFAGFNPFASQANHMPMQLDWRGFGGLGPAIGTALTAIAFFAVLLAARRLLANNSGRALAVLVAGALLVTSGVRVMLPLRYVGYQSEMALVRKRIDLDRAAGRPVELPIEISEIGLWKARYYFAHDFKILGRVRKGAEREGVIFLLVERPSAGPGQQ